MLHLNILFYHLFHHFCCYCLSWLFICSYFQKRNYSKKLSLLYAVASAHGLRHLVCIFCLLQKFIGSWKHVRKIKPWVKKKISCFRVRLRIKNEVATRRKSKRPSSFRGGRKTSHSPPQRDQCIFATCSLGAGPPYIAPVLHQNEDIRTSTFCSGQALLLTFLLPSLFNPKEKRGGSEDNWGIFNLGKKNTFTSFLPPFLTLLLT